MNKYKIVMSDLDGTVVKNGFEIFDETKETLDKLIENDILFVPTTGRFLGVVPEYFLNHKDIRYIVASNGAVVIDRVNKEIIRDVTINKEDVLDMVEEAYSKGARIFLDSSRGVVVSRTIVNHLRMKQADFYDHVGNHIVEADDLLEVFKEEDLRIRKIDISFDDLELRNELYEKFKEQKSVSVVASSGSNIELTHKDAKKGLALEFLLNHLSIDKDKSLAIGDSDNDVSMIETAGLGIAMGNAKEYIKSHSDFVTKSIDENGFAYAMSKFIDFK